MSINTPPTSPGTPEPGALEQGDATHGIIPYKNPAALWGYYVSIAGLVVPLLGVVALILGIRGLRARKAKPYIRGAAHAWIAIILGGLTALAWAGCGASVLLAGVGVGGPSTSTSTTAVTPKPASDEPGLVEPSPDTPAPHAAEPNAR